MLNECFETWIKNSFGDKLDETEVQFAKTAFFSGVAFMLEIEKQIDAANVPEDQTKATIESEILAAIGK